MWRAAAFVVLLVCAGCGASDFYKQKSHAWFSNTDEEPEPPKEDGAGKTVTQPGK